MYLSPYPPGCTPADIDDAYGPDEDDEQEDDCADYDYWPDDDEEDPTVMFGHQG